MDTWLHRRNVVDRAIAVSQMFEERTKIHEASKKKDQALPLDLQADASYCMLRDVLWFPPMLY